MPRLTLVPLCLFGLLLLTGCGGPAAVTATQLNCAAVEGLDALPRAELRTVFLTAGTEARSPEDSSLAVNAAAALACPFAAEQRSVRILVDAGANVAALTDTVAKLSTMGAQISVATMDAPPAGSTGALRSEHYQAQLAGLQTNGGGDLVIVAGAFGEASRTALGPSHARWLPLAARLPANHTLSLRLQASPEPGLRLQRTPVEDIDGLSAPATYDGVLDVGPDQRPLP